MRSSPGLAIWLVYLMLLPHSQSKPAVYNNRFNKTCKYAAFNVSKELFVNGLDGETTTQFSQQSCSTYGSIFHALLQEAHCRRHKCRIRT